VIFFQDRCGVQFPLVGGALREEGQVVGADRTEAIEAGLERGAQAGRAVRFQPKELESSRPLPGAAGEEGGDMLGPVRACEGIVDYRDAGRATLCLAGAVTGLGVAAMHYLGMAAVQLNGSIRYDPPPVALSVLSSWRRRSVVVQSRTTRP
jgi:hypothetical protein